jgi:hypothetical protein
MADFFLPSRRANVGRGAEGPWQPIFPISTRWNHLNPRAFCYLLSPPPLMLHHQTRILHDHHPRNSRPLRRLRILNPQLHPQHLRPNPNRRLGHRPYLLRPPKYIHNIHRLRHILQPRVSLLPQNLRLIRIHRNNPIPRGFKILRHPMRSPHRIRRQPDYRDRLSSAQNLRHNVATRCIFFRNM